MINTPAGQDGLKIDLASRLCVSLSSFHSSLPPDRPSCQRASALSLSPQAPRCRASLSPSSEVAGKGRALPFSEPPAVFQSLLRFSPQHLTARPCSSVPLCLGAAGLPRAGKGSFAGSCVSLPPARPGPARRHRRYVPPRTRFFGPLPLPSPPPRRRRDAARPSPGRRLSRRAAPASCAAGEARFAASAQVRAGGHRAAPTAAAARPPAGTERRGAPPPPLPRRLLAGPAARPLRLSSAPSAEGSPPLPPSPRSFLPGSAPAPGDWRGRDFR